MLKPYLYIDKTATMGKGVFTKERIAKNTVLEESPVVVMSKTDREYLDKTKLHDYIFEWGKDLSQCCMALGLVPMYNHSYNSNCEYYMDFDEETIMIKAVRNIEKGEELTINYNGDSNDATPLWFDAV
ncbi:MAG: SET domain-containing protein-lysine N-methyltransferase [Bacteroidetes bacterium]|nr:SET domain-containing protein-lysine N-methyltransferase [Bacteroidota bacterium]